MQTLKTVTTEELAAFAVRLEAEIRLSGVHKDWFVELGFGRTILHRMERLHQSLAAVRAGCGQLIDAGSAALTDSGDVFPSYCTNCLLLAANAELGESAEPDAPLRLAS